jgi:hypothetical protein
MTTPSAPYRYGREEAKARHCFYHSLYLYRSESDCYDWVLLLT